MKSFTIAGAALLSMGFVFSGQICCGQSDSAPSSQALVEVEGSGQPPTIGDVTISVDGKKQPLLGWTPVSSSGTQVAILIDDGLASGVNQELTALRSFINELPDGVQVFIGYLSNGSIIQAQGFTANHAGAAQHVRPVRSTSSESASPYFYLSAFIRQWPSDHTHARFILMLASGNDPHFLTSSATEYRSNPYLKAAVEDANAAGVSVSSAAYPDDATTEARLDGARLGGVGRALLRDLSDGTGGHAFQQPNQNTASLAPYLADFKQSIFHTYIATFSVKANAKGLLDFKPNTKVPGMKLRTAAQVSAHNIEMTAPPPPK